MARKSVQVGGFEGRDEGKVFVLTEMPAMRAEKWATRALLALARSGVDVPEDVTNEGMAGIARVGFGAIAGAKFEEIEPLLDEMLECVQVMPDVNRPEMLRAPLEEDFEEISTIVRLRGEVLKLHVDFSQLAGRLKSPAGDTTAAPGSLEPKTSPPQ